MIEAPVVKDITSIYDKAITPTTEEANKQLLIEARDKALYEVTNIGATRMRDSQDIYTIKALRELFLTIKNRNDSNDAIDLTTGSTLSLMPNFSNRNTAASYIRRCSAASFVSAQA